MTRLSPEVLHDNFSGSSGSEKPKTCNGYPKHKQGLGFRGKAREEAGSNYAWAGLGWADGWGWVSGFRA